MIKICAVAGAVMLVAGILTTFAAVSFGGARRLGSGVKNAVHRAMSWADDDWADDLEDPDYWDELWEDDFWSDEASHSKGAPRIRPGTGLVRAGTSGPGREQRFGICRRECYRSQWVKTPGIPQALPEISQEPGPQRSGGDGRA